MNTEKKTFYAIQVSAPANTPNPAGHRFSEAALTNAVNLLNKRPFVSGEFDSPKVIINKDVPRYLRIDETKAILFAKNFKLTEKGIVADLYLNETVLGRRVQSMIDNGTVERGEYGFRIRAFYLNDDIVNGVVENLIPVGVDFIQL